MYDYDFSGIQNQIKEFTDKCVEANTKSWELGTQYLEGCSKRHEALVSELVENSVEAFKSLNPAEAGKDLIENSSAQIKNLQERYLQLNEENSSAYMQFAEEIQKLYQPLYQFEAKADKPAAAKKKRAA